MQRCNRSTFGVQCIHAYCQGQDAGAQWLERSPRNKIAFTTVAGTGRGLLLGLFPCNLLIISASCFSTLLTSTTTSEVSHLIKWPL
eukprot:2522371-Amphidinium_carterae.1